MFPRFEIKVSLFGAFRDFASSETLILSLAGVETVKDVKNILSKKLLENARATFDIEALVAKSVLATDEKILAEWDLVGTSDLSILPPVCGG